MSTNEGTGRETGLLEAIEHARTNHKPDIALSLAFALERLRLTRDRRTMAPDGSIARHPAAPDTRAPDLPAAH